MRKVNPPNLTHSEIIQSCVINIHDKTLIQRVNNNLQIFENASLEYKKKGYLGCLDQIDNHSSVNGIITKSEMKFLYEKMVKKGNLARGYYDEIIHQSIKCPYCGYGTSTTLDHYLPKSEFPMYAVDPINLVPCCKDCNTTKLARTLEDSQQLHAYFDNVDDERWLYCEVGYFETLAFKFVVKKPASWSEEKFNKMKNHFSLFNLNNLFIGFASDEFSDSIFELKTFYDQNGKEALENHLILKFESCYRNLKNHWKTALYGALKDEEYFCDWIKDFIFC